MKRLTTVFLVCVITILSALPLHNVMAQQDAERSKTSPSRLQMQKLTPAERKANQEMFNKKYPLLAKIKKMQPASSELLKSAARFAPQIKAKGSAIKNTMKTADGRELRGNLVHNGNWAMDREQYGMYSFKASSPITMSPLGLNYNMNAMGGGAIVGNQFHCINYIEFSGSLFMYHYSFNTETWETVINGDVITDYSLLATETATDNATGTVYGQFYNSYLDGLEFGVIDYNTMTRTTISTSTNTYVALGLANDNMLYGVATDGNLYKINTGTGEENLVGSTGIAIEDTEGKYYNQSGEIDPKTNTFYWASINANGMPALYTVDINTGAATKVADFYNSEQILALSVVQPEAEDGAPAAPTNFSVITNGGSLDCEASATAPSTTYGGDELTGTLNYDIRLNGGTVATGQITPGGRIYRPITDAPEGLNTFTVTVSNEVGTSPEAKQVKYIGYDTPKPVTDLNMEVDDNGNASLSWTAPSEGVNNGYLGTLKYTVTRYPDNAVVASNLSETSFSETIPVGSMATYYYGVKAVNEGKESAETASNGKVLGDVIIPPYSETFDTEGSADLFSIIDSNKDGYTWKYQSAEQLMAYGFTGRNNADDWLLTPPVKLNAGKMYKVSFDVSCGQKTYPERIEVKYGKGNTVEDMTTELMPPTEIKELESAPYKFEQYIVTEEDMTIHIGFHAISDADMYYLQLDNIKISEGSSTNAPDEVTGVEIIPDPTGASNATIKFNAPEKTMGGKPLTSLTKIEVKRGEELLKTFETPQPGAELSFNDDTPSKGTNRYTFTAYNEDGTGKGLTAAAYIGTDTPLPPESSTLTDQTSSIRIDWVAASKTGVNGGVVVQEQVTYNVYDIVQGNYGQESVLRDNTASTNYTVEGATNEGKQKLMQYALASVNSEGTSATVLTPAIVVGKPYEMPFHDSFAGGDLAYDLWWIGNTGKSSFGIASSLSSDGDGGCIGYLSETEGDVSYINTGKISLESANSPLITFKHSGEKGNGLVLDVIVYKADGTEEKLFTFDYNTTTETPENKWYSATIDLDESCLSQPYIIVKFKVTANKARSIMYIDDVNVRNNPAKDLAANIEAPGSITKGSTAKVKVEVKNVGKDAAEEYSLSFFVDNEEIELINETMPLLASESKTYEFECTPSLFNESEKITLKAEVNYNEDMNTENNTATAEVETKYPDLPAPANATVDNKTAGQAEVRWAVPTLMPKLVTEDFENYAPWSISNLGDWTLVDADKALCQPLFNGLPYTHQGEAFAYIVFNPNNLSSAIIPTYPQMTPHSGEQYLTAIYATDTSEELADQDNWLISPELPGTEQTISFWVSNYVPYEILYIESFEVLYSTGGTDIADFVKIGSTHNISNQKWTQIEVTLPEGAKHFAIRHVSASYDSYFFMVDDITYTIGSSEVKGYNIYRDGQKVGSVTAENTAFTDTNVPEGTYTYAVTAVYAKGESAPAKAEPTVILGIDQIESEAGITYDVYTVDGKCIGLGMKSLKQLKPSVYVINNKKMTVK